MRLFFIVLFLVSCKSALKKDLIPSAIDSGYPTVEINACDTTFVGIGVCKVEHESDLSDLVISVQGYYKGTLQVDSDAAKLHATLKYENHQKIPIFLSGTADKSFMIDFVLSPEYPDETKSGIIVQALKGRLRVEVIHPGIPYVSDSVKIKQNTEYVFPLALYEGETVKTIISGCEADFSQFGIGPILVPLSSLRRIPFVQDCVFEGVILGFKYPTRFTWQVWSYSEDFVPLPIPKVYFSNDTLVIEADKSVSIISVDNEYKITNKGKFNCQESKSHTLRIITVNGRVLIGKWDKKWTWLE